MATFDVFNMKREKVGSIDLADEVFGAEVKEHLFYEVVKAQLASQATRHARPRRTARRSAAAPRSSTSRRAPAARVTARSARPIYVGGGQAHPPRPRDWSYQPAAPGARSGAHERALEVRQGRPPPRGRPLRARRDQDEGAPRGARRAQGREEDASSSTARTNEKLKLSIRNCKSHQFLPPEGVNVYDLLRHDTLILSKDAAKKLEAALPRSRAPPAASSAADGGAQ